MKKVISILFPFLLSLSCSNNDTNDIDDTNLMACQGDVILKSQSEVSDFEKSGCQRIEGNLLIIDIGQSETDPIDLRSLDGLQNLVEITGYMSIVYNPLIENVSGLNNLKKVKGITIHSNNNLKQIMGLNQISTKGLNLSIERNKNLSSINGFNEVQEIRTLSIRANQSLSSVSGFNKLIKTGNFYFDNPTQQIDAFSSLNQIAGELRYWNTKTTQMPPFSHLEYIEEDLWIEGNNNMTSLKGLESLRNISNELKVGYFGGNENLSTFDGLNNLESVSLLHIQYNSSLVDLNGLEKLTVAKVVRIYNNDILSNFCAISTLVESMEVGELSPRGSNPFEGKDIAITANKYDPILVDFENGDCSL